jgi:hypothetical protein
MHNSVHNFQACPIKLKKKWNKIMDFPPNSHPVPVRNIALR